jgi:hypothetical protein
LSRHIARAIGAAALLAFCLTLLPGQALASRPSSPADIKSILEAVQTSPLLSRIPGKPFIVTKITISTASADPVYASGVVTPRAVKGRRGPAVQLLFRQNPNLSWTLLDFGSNFCGDADVPGAVLRDLFHTSCGGSGGGSSPGAGVTTLGSASAGNTTVSLVAARTTPAGAAGIPRASVFVNVAVRTPLGNVVVAQQQVGRASGFNWNLLNRNGGGGVLLLPSIAAGPQFITVSVRRSAVLYGSASYTFQSNVLLPASGALPTPPPL